MATNGDSVSTGTTFSHLFDNNTSHAASMGFESFGFSPSFSNGTNSPMMLCFGGENQKSQVCVGVGVVESSSPSSSNNSCSSNYLSKSKKPHCRETKKAEGNKESGPGSGNRGGQSRKRSKTEKNPSSMGSIKVRKQNMLCMHAIVTNFATNISSPFMIESKGSLLF
ncbi:hypothetical protein GIB67_023625 [Kingdonia uniflora]|uniref:Uncharacterized protein n=1 Tax=Kingdonia uniflora TaxID=39325 RepID=A0A7J7L4X5_9MAGN|nr:hypothetical protein GIB67_023625 [Kingdonia uniflora]